jgi:hypothetical protein
LAPGRSALATSLGLGVSLLSRHTARAPSHGLLAEDGYRRPSDGTGRRPGRRSCASGAPEGRHSVRVESPPRGLGKGDTRSTVTQTRGERGSHPVIVWQRSGTALSGRVRALDRPTHKRAGSEVREGRAGAAGGRRRDRGRRPLKNGAGRSGYSDMRAATAATSWSLSSESKGVAMSVVDTSAVTSPLRNCTKSA